MINTELKKRILTSIIILPIAIFSIYHGSLFFLFFLCVLFFLTSYEWFKMSKTNYLICFFGVLFLIFSFFSAFFVRENMGQFFFLFIIFICILTDLGGYVFGKIFKGPKLTKVSPNKTYSGVAGSFLFSLVVGIFSLEYLNSNLLEKNLIKVSLGILFISLISQLGDLIISYFKRKANLKDTGNILPGHGGLLDRVDGMIFVIPTIFIFTFVT